MMSTEATDVIDRLAAVEPGSSLDGIRSRRSQARENAQKSYLALFEPVDFCDFAAADRYAVAAFVAGLHGEAATANFYLVKLAGGVDQSETLKAEIRRGKTEGPYGAFSAGPLSVEDKPGLIYRVGEGSRRVLGARLAAALEHAHLLVFHPRDAAPAALQTLLDAGWSSTAIVTLSQLVSFLSFQVRTVAGLQTLAASRGRHADAAAEAS